MENGLSGGTVGSSGAEVTRRQQLALIAYEGKSEDKGQM